jgi:BRCA1-associated ATM activator 1
MVLRNNQEGIVRKEACNLLCEIYQNEKLTPSFKQTLYEHMTSSAISDFHWEVQLTALKFWRVVIQSFLADQGMLDGTFPPVTFSRTSRKIVTLNEAEVQKRLFMTLEELASAGCLTALLKLVNDDTEVEVMDAALAIAQELFAILLKYKVPHVIKPQDDEPKSVEDLLCNIKETVYENSDNAHEMEAETSDNAADNIIEGILNEGDINLLADLYKKQMQLQKPEILTAPRIRLLKPASPYLFVTFMNSNNCKTIIQEKKEWNDGIRSVSSLLDDVLGLYEITNEANSLDCY